MSKRKPPKYAHHKSSGQARVRIDGRDIYLGPYGSPESHQRYASAVAEWMARQDAAPTELTVGELTLLFGEHAKRHYQKNGRQTTEVGSIQLALRHVNRLYRNQLASGFAPKMLKAVRQAMIDAGQTRNGINSQIGRIRRMFRWAVSEELVKPEVLVALESVADLQRGRSNAAESKPVRPVPRRFITSILKRVPRPVRGMIDFQLATGARPGEARILRACDLNMSGPIWEYRPAEHKTEHHGKDRVIMIGPKGQRILRQFLTTDVNAYLFCPSGSGGCRPYERSSYRNAITRACKAANVPEWSPNQLRHNFATEARRQFGIERARTAMGHASTKTTEIYAERDIEAARAVIAKIG